MKGSPRINPVTIQSEAISFKNVLLTDPNSSFIYSSIFNTSVSFTPYRMFPRQVATRLTKRVVTQQARQMGGGGHGPTGGHLFGTF